MFIKEASQTKSPAFTVYKNIMENSICLIYGSDMFFSCINICWVQMALFEHEADLTLDFPKQNGVSCKLSNVIRS